MRLLRRLLRWCGGGLRRVEPPYDEAALAECVSLHHLERRMRELDRGPWARRPTARAA